jgi:hypothetical protein
MEETNALQQDAEKPKKSRTSRRMLRSLSPKAESTCFIALAFLEILIAGAYCFIPLYFSCAYRFEIAEGKSECANRAPARTCLVFVLVIGILVTAINVLILKINY